MNPEKNRTDALYHDDPALSPTWAVGAFGISFAFALIAFSLVAPAGLWALAIAQVLAFGLLPVALVRGLRLPVARALGITRPSWRALAGAACIGVSFWYLNNWLIVPITALYSDPAQESEVVRSLLFDHGGGLAGALLGAALVPAVAEEILMRGAVTRGLRPLGHPAAVIVSAVLFGLLHGARALPATCFGLILGWMVLAGRSLLPVILCHLLNNTVAILVAAGALGAVGTGLLTTPELGIPIAAVVCGLGVGLLRDDSRRARRKSKS